jgi:hypothetical protein
MIDTTNRCMVGVVGDKVVLLNPPRPTVPMSRDEALTLAAYLVTMADPAGKRFAEILEAVQNA